MIKNGIIIDTNIFSAVFNQQDQKHPMFKSIYELIYSTPKLRSVLVYGGTTYLKEMGYGRNGQYLRVILELNKKGRARNIETGLVDARELVIKKLCSDKDFDDPHIVALSVLSKCPMICTDDARSNAYLKQKEFYDKGCKVPIIYSSSSHTRATKLLNRYYP